MGGMAFPGTYVPVHTIPPMQPPEKKFPIEWFFVGVFKPFGMYHEPVF
jgi:hypothetical protein